MTSKLYDCFLRRVQGNLPVRQGAPLWRTDSMPEPEIPIVPGDGEDDRNDHPSEAKLVVEIAVDSAALDRENASLYAEASIAEYWIVPGEAKEIETYRRPINGLYQEKCSYQRGETIPCACVEGGEVTVETLFA